MESGLEEMYFNTAFWLWAARYFEAGGSPWEMHAWRSPYRPGEYLPVVAALKERGFRRRRVGVRWPWHTDTVWEHIVYRLPKHPTAKYEERGAQEIRTITIHHSASPATTTPEAIARYHVNNNGWPGIGYHFVVTGDGRIYQTNELTTVSYHAQSGNRESVGVCFTGDFTKGQPTPEQLDSGKKLMAALLHMLGLGRDAVVPHSRYVPTTACPGGNWWQAILGAPTAPPVDPKEEIRRAAWDSLGRANGVPYNPASAFYKFARLNSLGAPQTPEVTLSVNGVPYRFQGYAKGIVLAEVGKWDQVEMIAW
jgi:hypothetical protein